MSLMTNAPSPKAVMRIAMVGIRPADQVMLKGYLRILLRLEVALEWLPANHPSIDLFMVNKEFSESDSVKRLLESRTEASKLYISRSQTDQGSLQHNQLVLPLKDLEPLKAWLFNHIRFLATLPAQLSQRVQTAENNLANPSATREPSNQTSNHTVDPIQTARTIDNPTDVATADTPTTTNLATNANAPTALMTEVQLSKLVSVILQLQQREDKLLRLEDSKGQHLADIHPKQQRIWPVSNPINLNDGLCLVPSPVLAVTTATSQDLVQWFWQLGLEHASLLSGLLLPNSDYHLTGWVKPKATPERHDQLKIQSILESRTITIPTLIQVSECDVAQVHRSIIGLIVAGLMPTSIYQALSQRYQSDNLVSTNTMSTATSNLILPVWDNVKPRTSDQALTIVDTHSSPVSVSEPTPSDSISSNSVASDSTPLSKSVSEPLSTPATTDENVTLTNNDTANNGMKGFLSRLRRKLGL